jgi:hypothetical protein
MAGRSGPRVCPGSTCQQRHRHRQQVLAFHARESGGGLRGGGRGPDSRAAGSFVSGDAARRIRSVGSRFGAQARSPTAQAAWKAPADRGWRLCAGPGSPASPCRGPRSRPRSCPTRDRGNTGTSRPAARSATKQDGHPRRSIGTGAVDLSTGTAVAATGCAWDLRANADFLDRGQCRLQRRDGAAGTRRRASTS